jgi:hypothetical protein
VTWLGQTHGQVFGKWFGYEAPPEPDPEQSSTGYGGGWDFDFGSLAKRIEDERQDRDNRRAELERLYRKATGQDLQDVAEVKPAAQSLRQVPKRQQQAERIQAIEAALVQVEAIAEVEQSIARLEQQIEEADIVWITSAYA